MSTPKHVEWTTQAPPPNPEMLEGRRPQLVEQMDCLGKHVSVLEELCTQLVTQLKPVTYRPDEPKVTPEGSSQMESKLCPAAALVAVINSRLICLGNDLGQLSAALEV